MYKLRKGISAAEVPHEEPGVRVPQEPLQPRIPVPGREVPITSHNKPAEIVAERGLLESQAFFLKNWYVDLLTDRHTCSEFQCWCRSSKGSRALWGETEFPGFRARAGGAASPRQCAGRGHGSFAEPSPSRDRQESSSTMGPHKLLPVNFSYKRPVLAHVVEFLKISQRLQITNRQNLASECPIYFVTQPQAWHYQQPSSVCRLACPRHLQAQQRGNHLQITL